MSRHPSRRSHPVLAFVFLSAVALGVAFVISHVPKPAAPTGSVMASSTQSGGPALVFRGGEAVTVVQGDQVTRLTPAGFAAKVTADDVLPEGSAMSNGTKALFAVDPSNHEQHLANTSLHGKTVAALDVPRPDEASVVTVKPAQGESRAIVLRDAKGRSFKDANLIGWLDDTTLGLTAVMGGERWLLSLDSTGNIQSLAKLPEGLIALEPRAGAFWYVTATLGEGLESSPQAPSDLYRVTANGVQALMFHDEAHVITAVLPGPDGLLTVTTDDGSSRLIDAHGSVLQRFDTARPVLFISSTELLLRDGFQLSLYDVVHATRIAMPLGVPEGNVEVFVIPHLPHL